MKLLNDPKTIAAWQRDLEAQLSQPSFFAKLASQPEGPAGLKAIPLYPEVDPEDFAELYAEHVSGMTAAGLHRKTDIAAQLAWRDAMIQAQAALLLEALPYVEEGEQFNKPGRRGLSATIRQHLKPATRCEHCNGRGHIEQSRRSREGDEDVTEAMCPRCQGDGTIGA